MHFVTDSARFARSVNLKCLRPVTSSARFARSAETLKSHALRHGLRSLRSLRAPQWLNVRPLVDPEGDLQTCVCTCLYEFVYTTMLKIKQKYTQTSIKIQQKIIPKSIKNRTKNRPKINPESALEPFIFFNFPTSLSKPFFGPIWVPFWLQLGAILGAKLGPCWPKKLFLEIPEGIQERQ